jgi:hypothetical protein
MIETQSRRLMRLAAFLLSSGFGTAVAASTIVTIDIRVRAPQAVRAPASPVSTNQAL